MAVLVAISPAACSNTGAGAASHAASNSSRARSDVPRVAHPLQTAEFSADPQATCSVLTVAQVRALGIHLAGQPKPSRDPAGDPGCLWSDESSGLNIGVGFPAGKNIGLDNTYKLNQSGWFAYFEPTTIDGYPAVWAAGADQRNNGECVLNIGIADNLEAILDVARARNRADCLRLGRRLAASVITTIKASQ